jgi:aldehyde dehydrogenase (NAD(P)+)
VEVKVVPTSGLDAALFSGFTVHELMLPGVTAAAVREKQASFFQQNEPRGGVSLILGAGNVSSIPPTDALYKLFAEGYVTLIKMNPVNEWVGPHLEKAFKPFIDRGFMRIAYGAGDVGKYLVEHQGVNDVHITGSNHTHDLIVWGPPGEERERRKRENNPVLKKRITSELGNVSPVAVVPAQYSAGELEFMAKNVAAMITNNASFNCNAAKILITAEGWPQRDQFMAHIERTLGETPTRLAYYPGAFDRYQKLTSNREKVKKLGSGSEKNLPWTILYDIDSAKMDEPLFSTEPFCSILSETRLDAKEPAEFVVKATKFMNETLWGTLNAMFVVPPKLEASGEVGKAIDDAIISLRYGTVAINHWPAVVFATMSPAWGGHPSATLQDVQSGIGWVHNTYLLEGIEKSVLRGPLTVFPKPAWFGDNKKVAAIGKKLLKFEHSPSWLKVPSIAITALQG